ALVVEAELPGAAAEALNRQAGTLAADRAPFLQPPEVIAAAWERAADRAGIGRLGVVADPPFAAVHALPALELDDAQPVGPAVLALPPGLLADLAGAEALVLVHPRPNLLRQLLAAVVDLVVGLVQQLAAVADDVVLGHLAGHD